MKREDLAILNDKISQAVQMIGSLRDERDKLNKLAERQKEDINFYQKESRTAEKLMTQNQRFENDREKIRGRIQMLLERLEKAGI